MTDLSRAILTDHARSQMERRGLSEDQLRAVLAAPDEVRPVRPGRVVAQSVRQAVMIRVFVDIDRDPPEVVTAYRTSKIGKYRS